MFLLFYIDIAEIFADSLPYFFSGFLPIIAILTVFILLIVIIQSLFKRLENKIIKNRRTKKLIQHSNVPAYALVPSLLTPRELNFFNILLPIATARGHYVAIKPRIADFVTANTEHPQCQANFFAISSKHIDFLVIDSESKPLFGVELDDTSHNKPDRIKRDIFVDSVYNSINLTIHHIRNFSAEAVQTFFKLHENTRVLDTLSGA
jgi:hypothetical protein